MSELQKHTLNLRKGDYEWLADNFANTGNPASSVIRMIVSNFVDKLAAQHKDIQPDLTEVKDTE